MLSGFWDDWFEGLTYTITDDLISFYTYFTLVFAEIAYLWAFIPGIALPFTGLFILCILTIIICSYIKSEVEGGRPELFVSRIYTFLFLVFFVVGMFIDWKANLILFLLPLGITYLFTKIRMLQQTLVFVADINKLVVKVAMSLLRFFNKRTVWYISQVVILGVPMVLFIWALWQTGLTESAKLFVSIGYVFLSPLLAFMEDSLAAQNIFELGYEIVWSKEYEQEMKKLIEKHGNDPEKIKDEIVAGVMKQVVEMTKKSKKMVDDIAKEAEKNNKK